MNRIRALPPLLRNKIAAGEVIERPASVVKELAENSIDAGSTRIEITISGAGKKLIRVSDNGCGISRDDALPAFERYATSKITEEDDLYRIRTMGFRGEALSSIASVSRVRLVTAPGDSGGAVGVAVEIAGGEVKDVRDCPATGTFIEVKDLFFNTPARRKFLKTDTTENHHIIDVVTREALSHHDIGFVLRVEEDDLFSLSPASSLRERLAQVCGKQFTDGLMEVSVGDEGLSITAFFGRAADARINRNSQFVFINRRSIRDPSINHAVYKAYDDIMPRGKHPAFFIFMEIDPGQIDVNVHPAKREVRFRDKTGVYDLVYRAAREALKGSVEDFISVASDGEHISAGYSVAHDGPAVGSQFDGLPEEARPAMLSEPQAMQYEAGIPALYVCETFVAIAGGDGLTILDYHAAHERINFERLLKKRGMDSQRLLFPQQVRLEPKDYSVVLRNLEAFREFGIDVEDFGHGTLIVRSLPQMLLDADLAALLSDSSACLLGNVTAAAGDDPIGQARRSMAARIACHSSVRGRELPDSVKIAAILKDLKACDEPDRCPHGRPTRINISQAELKKMFKK
jgi:DNA mismatch repair protein MutL